MKTLKLNSLMRNLTLLAAGAFMATLVVLPVTGSANDDEPYSPEVVPPATYMLVDSDSTVSLFTLVDNDGSRVLTLVEEPAVRTNDDDDDDD